MIVSLADHVNLNVRLVQFQWVMITIKLILIHALIAVLAQEFVLLRLSIRHNYYSLKKRPPGRFF